MHTSFSMLYQFVLGWDLRSKVKSSCLEGRTENPAGLQAIVGLG